MSAAAEFMENVRTFPLSPRRPDGSRSYWSVIFAGCTIVLAILGGVLAAGSYVGTFKTELDQAAKIEVQQQVKIDQLTDAIAALTAGEASATAQITSLRQALDDERQERIDLEHSLNFPRR